MLLTKQQRIEIVLMSGSSRKIAEEFNRKHRTSITHDAVAKLFVKLKNLDLLKIKEEVVDHVLQRMKTHRLEF